MNDPARDPTPSQEVPEAPPLVRVYGDEDHLGLDADEVEMLHGDARGTERITAPDPRWGW